MALVIYLKIFSVQAFIFGAAAMLCLSSALANPVPDPKANPADPDKVLRLAFPVAETGFDPVRVNDLYSNTITAALQ